MWAWTTKIRKIGIFLLSGVSLLAICTYLLCRDAGSETAESEAAEAGAENSLFAEISFTPAEETGENAVRLQYAGNGGSGGTEQSSAGETQYRAYSEDAYADYFESEDVDGMESSGSFESYGGQNGESDEESCKGKDSLKTDAGAGEKDSESGRWEAYIPSEFQADDKGSLCIHMRSGYKLQILDADGAAAQEWKDGDRIEPVWNTSCRARLLDRLGRCREETTLRFYRSENVASLYLNIDSAKFQWVNRDRNNSALCRYSAYRADGEPDASGECKISGRGHSTWVNLKKPYNLNLTEEASLLGMNKSSKYCILANVFDHSNLRNWTAQNLAADLDMPYTPQCEFVNVYINGAYNGLYLLSQRVKANGGSICAEQSADLHSGAERVLIFDGRAKYREYFISTEHRTAIVSYPKDPSDDELDEIQSLYQAAENAVFASDGIDPDTGISVDQYLDLDSWERMYVFQECFAQTDAENFSFYTCMLPGDTHIYAAPMWDFDLSGGFNWKGNYSTLLVRTQLLRNRQKTWSCHLIADSEQFREQSFQYYQEVLCPAMEQYLGGKVEDKAEEIRQAALMNRARWQFRDDPDEEVSEYLRWLRDREDFLLAYWADPDAYCRVHFDFGWGDQYYYVKRGDQLGYLPAAGMDSGRYGEEASEDDLLGWEDDDGNMVTAELSVNDDITLHAVWKD